MNLTNFPPLHVDETPVPTPGYDGDYKKYNADEIINIVKNIREAPLPLSSQDGKPLNPQEHSHSMTSTPNMDLLKRQRSFSIEETREQLQQGRPVHKEAVAAGPVDYSAMIYGDAFGRSASIDDSITPADITGTSVNSMSAAHTSGGSAHGAAGHAGQGSSNSAAAGGKAKKGNSQPPSASSWAALVKSSASPSGTQTDTLASAAGSSQSKPSSNQAQTSNGKDSNKQGGNGRVEKQSNGSSTGQNLGGRNNNNISNGGSKDNKDKDGQKGNSKGGEKNQGRAKNGRKKEVSILQYLFIQTMVHIIVLAIVLAIV
mgnify:CR=1 FL=1